MLFVNRQKSNLFSVIFLWSVFYLYYIIIYFLDYKIFIDLQFSTFGLLKPFMSLCSCKYIYVTSLNLLLTPICLSTQSVGFYSKSNIRKEVDR